MQKIALGSRWAEIFGAQPMADAGTNSFNLGSVSMDDSLRCPELDDRIDRRLRAVLVDLGMAGRAESSAIKRADGIDKMLAEVGSMHEQFNGLYEALPNHLAGDRECTFIERDIRIDSDRILRLRIFGDVDRVAKKPCILYLHGGGMVILQAFNKVHSRWCQDLSNRGVIVVLAEFANAYSNGVHCPFPAGLKDCFNVLLWIDEHRDELGISNIILQGESGGANLALATAMMANKLKKSDLISGVYATVPYISGAYAWSQERKSATLPSLNENDGYFISCAMLDLLVAVYDPTSSHAENPLCWPYHASREDLEGLPPHVIVVNELDPLRDEGIAHLRNLVAAGVEARGVINLGLVHAADLIFRQALPDVYFNGISAIAEFARYAGGSHIERSRASRTAN